MLNVEERNIKSIFIWLVKVFIACCLAFAILNMFSFFYRGGLPSIVDETMAAPVRYVPNSFYSTMTEGISIGFYDDNGFNNAYPKDSTIEYLCLGSSQTEAKQVMPNQNYVYDLNVLMNKNGKNDYAYNIGVSGEHVAQCISRLNRAIDTYKPSKAIIIETTTLEIPKDEIEEAMKEVEQGELLFSYEKGIMGFIRKLPFVRLVYVQYEAVKKNRMEKSETYIENEDLAVFDRSEYSERIRPLIRKASCNSGNLPVIILFHEEIDIRSDGTVIDNRNNAMSSVFKEICDEEGVYFIDMYERFRCKYETEYILPYGFANTTVGHGHLNKYGHEMIAEELYGLIMGIE